MNRVKNTKMSTSFYVYREERRQSVEQREKYINRWFETSIYVQLAIYYFASFALAREYLARLMAFEWAIQGNDSQLLHTEPRWIISGHSNFPIVNNQALRACIYTSISVIKWKANARFGGSDKERCHVSTRLKRGLGGRNERNKVRTVVNSS